MQPCLIKVYKIAPHVRRRKGTKCTIYSKVKLSRCETASKTFRAARPNSSWIIWTARSISFRECIPWAARRAVSRRGSRNFLLHACRLRGKNLYIAPLESTYTHDESWTVDIYVFNTYHVCRYSLKGRYINFSTVQSKKNLRHTNKWSVVLQVWFVYNSTSPIVSSSVSLPRSSTLFKFVICSARSLSSRSLTTRALSFISNFPPLDVMYS